MIAFPFKAKTKVSWAGEEEGDLGFLENEIVEVFAYVDDSWWNGKLRRNGAEGIFPREYVEVLEDKLSHSSSTQSLTPVKGSRRTTPKSSPSKQQTPVKDLDYEARYRSSKSNTPLTYTPNASHCGMSKSSPKRSSQLINADVSQEYDDEIDCSFDTSYGNVDPIFYGQRKSYSSSHLPNSARSSKMRSNLQRQDQIRERDLEYERSFDASYRRSDYKRNSFQQEKQMGYGASDPQYEYSSPKQRSSNKKTQQIQDPYANYPDSPLSPKFISESYTDLSAAPSGRSSQLFKNHTVESFSPEPSPSRSKTRTSVPKSSIFQDKEYDEITAKRQQLEMELERLKKLEKSSQRKIQTHIISKANVSRDTMYENSVESSYVSEGVLSSKKNYQSKDDLGRKLARNTTEDEINEEEEEEENYYFDDEIDDENSPANAPPPPPKHMTPKSFDYSGLNGKSVEKSAAFGGKGTPYDADDFRFSGQSHKSYLADEDLRQITMQQEELKNSIKSLQSDVLNLSELSATSAGSFLRHKIERESQNLNIKGLSINEDSEPMESSYQPKENSKEVVDSVFQEKKSKNSSIFKKLLNKKATDEPANLMERKLQNDDELNWMTFKTELNRMKSLTSEDKQARTKRVVREDGPIIVKPLDYISEINTNETLGPLEELPIVEKNDLLFKKADTFIENYGVGTDLNDLISDISVKFNSSNLCKIRCVLIHLCKFRIIEETRISQIKPKLGDVLRKGEASLFQLNYLFKKILDALRIPSEVILGFWKKPNEYYHNEQYVINHCWLSTLIDGQFFIIDLYCFKNGSVCNIRNSPKDLNEFYFLAQPLSIVSTHIPSIIDLQHVVPPIDQNIAFHLPRSYSGFYINNLKFRNFNNALTKLKDQEFFELELEVPVDVELFTLIKTSKITTNELTLCQIKWISNTRIAKIKAILPQDESIGVLQVFAGPKGMQKHFDNIHQLAIVIPLMHTGSYKPCKFVPRFPTVQSQNNDLYIKQPQTSKIINKNSYNFEVLQHPSMGLNSGSGILNRDFKIVIESPSGKYFKLNKDDPSLPYGSYTANIKCQEVGQYRGLVIGDSGNSWYVFAQWESVVGSVVT